MNCMKCGREIPDEGVFCEDCLQEMERHPVKPGTVVLLPPKQHSSIIRRVPHKRRPPTAEEQVRQLKLRIRRLRIALALAGLLIIALAIPTFIHLTEGTRYLPGQNYSTFTEATEETEGFGESFFGFLDALTE